MRIAPDEVNVELPRVLVGGLKVGPVAALLRRVAADYTQLYEENEALKETVERLERGAAAVPAAAPAPQGGRPAVPREPDELARLVLSTAKQASAELRDSARRESEGMLRKASARSRQLEHDRAGQEAELAALDALRRETRAAMRSSLEAALVRPGGLSEH